MKSSFVMLATIAAAISFSSCSKDKSTTPPVVTPENKPLAVLKYDGNGLDSMKNLFVSGSWGGVNYVAGHEGNPSGALDFSGADKTKYGNLSIKGQSLTLAVWVKTAGGSMGVQNFITAMEGTTMWMSIFQSGNELGTTVSVPGTDNVTTPAVDNNWHHLAMTYDGKEMKIYLDGQLAGTKAHPGTIGDKVLSLMVGGDNTDFWKGALDDLRIYDVVKTKEEIGQLMAL